MIAEKILTELHGLGIAVSVDGDRIVMDGPEEALTEELVERIRHHKGLLMEHLDRRSNVVCFACKSSQWWRLPGGKWICAVCHPPAVSEDRIERVGR